MQFRAYTEGFTGHFETLTQLKAWAENLNRRYSLTGKPVSIWRAVWVAKDGSGAQYNAVPDRIITIGA